MILRITDDISRLAFKLKHWPTNTYMQDWEHLQLIIQPGQNKSCQCKEPLSPWYAYGCFYGVRTGIDLNNPPPKDFPAFCIPAFELDMDGRVVFILPERWKGLCFGRYHGMIRYMPMQTSIAFNAMPGYDISYKAPPKGVPPEFTAPSCTDRPEPEKPLPEMPAPRCCVLTRFDIDFGPRCSEYITESASFEFTLDTCGLD